MLFIAGIKHSGKTTFAKLLAEKYNLPHIDNDQLILEFLKIDNIRQFYKAEGKAMFMQAEALALASFLDRREDAVISLGGGAADNEQLITLLKITAPIIYLYRKEEDLLECILKDGIPPFLDKEDVENSFHRLFEQRDKRYREISDLTINLGPYADIDTTFKLILSQIGSFYAR